MQEPDTIVLISVDDLRYDALEFSGLDEWLADYNALDYRNTPTFDALADQAASFEHATSASSYTPPSHTTMFTGRYPKDHGVKTFFNHFNGADPTMAEVLSEKGYETVAWIENMALDMINATRGFDEVVCPFEDADADLFEFVEGVSGGNKTFVLIHLFDVHKPYCYTPGGAERERYNEGLYDRLDGLLPADCAASDLVEEAAMEASETVPNYDTLTDSLQEYATNWSLDYLLRNRLEERYGEDRFEYLVRLYQAGVSDFDRGRFADLIDALRAERLSENLMLVTSDHGEARCRWGDREDFMNSFNVSEQAIRVPLLLETDLVTHAGNSETPVNHVDLLPTVADAVGVDVPSDLPGTSLLSVLGGEESTRDLFAESWYYSGGADFFGNVKETGEGGLSEVATRRDGYKLIRAFEQTGSPEAALYDLGVDPFERTDRYEDYPEIASDLETRLDDYLDGVSFSCSPDLGEESSEEIEDRLRALGYLE